MEKDSSSTKAMTDLIVKSMSEIMTHAHQAKVIQN